MARITSKTLFFTTSPRTPNKMIPEIEALTSGFSGKPWNKTTQYNFMMDLISRPDYEGSKEPKDPAFSARDRITRAPKALGFVDLDPGIRLTPAGKLLISEHHFEEALLRQLLKFQLPSPFHIESDQVKGLFQVKPYLEIIRLIYDLSSLSFDELMLFGMQLINYNDYPKILADIKKFRLELKASSENYKNFIGKKQHQILSEIFDDEISTGNTSTRESQDDSVEKFLKTKKSNLRDYTDACFRYLRATGLFSISHRNKSLSIMNGRIDEVEYILTNVDRNPVFLTDTNKYKEYLFDSTLPVLYTDSKENLLKSLLSISDQTYAELTPLSIVELKELKYQIIQKNKEKIIKRQIAELKSYYLYSEVIDTYHEIAANNYYDTPLMFEWNTWRAMTMLNGGKITGNFKVDDAGHPMSTAIGNTSDITCDYGDFGLTVEVTMQSGQRQYEAEGEPVTRHLAKFKREIGKDAYCLFIAPRINEACIAHFYMLHKTNISYYGGTSVIVPIELETFMKMIENSNRVSYIPSPDNIKALFTYSQKAAEAASNEKEWYEAIQKYALNWLL